MLEEIEQSPRMKIGAVGHPEQLDPVASLVEAVEEPAVVEQEDE